MRRRDRAEGLLLWVQSDLQRFLFELGWSLVKASRGDQHLGDLVGQETTDKAAVVDYLFALLSQDDVPRLVRSAWFAMKNK